MTSNRILQINATATAATGLAMLAARGFLPPLFGLGSPLLLDLIAIFFLAYAAGLFFFAARPQVERSALLAFAAADGAWVVGSAVVLLMFWPQLTPIAPRPDRRRRDRRRRVRDAAVPRRDARRRACR